ncbi:hypothetical protein NT6N_03440 [Oceaniferula spumae]|uniref:Polysaccharide chain length determinant N-terminal domain-containing protein n=1 Tax=Oceaniferula spumae TaxID=2979115 RepID=A0AAT9FH63_9BACT
MNNSSSPEHIVLVETEGGALVPSDRHYAISTPISNSAHGGQHYGHGGGRGVQRAIFSVEEIFSYLRKYGLVAAIVGILVGVGLYSYVQSRTPVYESTAVILLNQVSNKQLNLQTVEREEQSEYTLPQLVNNMRNEIGSDKFKLSLYSSIDPELRERIIGKKSEDEVAMDDADIFLSRLSQQISIDVIKDSHMVSVTAKSDDKQIAAELANSYVEHFAKYTQAQGKETTQKVAAFLKIKAEDLLVRVKTLERELLDYRENTGIVAGQADSEFAVNKVNNLNSQLVDTKLQREKLLETLDNIEAAGNDPEDLLKVPALAENSVLANAYAKLAETRSEVESLSTDFGRKHPRMLVAVRQEGAALENLQKLVTQTIGSLQRQLKTTTTKVASLEKKVTEAKNEAHVASNNSVSQELKEEQLKAGRELYNNLVQQMHEANIALQFSGVERVRITEKAMPGRTPIFPRKPLSAVMATVAFGSCFLGIPLTLGFGKRVLELAKEPKDNNSVTGLDSNHASSSPLSCQPAPTALNFSLPQANKTSEPLNYPTLVTFPRENTSNPRDWVRVASDPNARSGIELNAYLTRLISEPNQARGLIVTSNDVNPAKTLSAAALALAASRRGLRTLLVSCENLTPEMAPSAATPNYNQRPKPAEELLSPFITEEDKLYFVTDEAWKRIPSLCLETLTNAHHCVDLLVLDAPLVSDETDLGIMSNFAASIVLVRNLSEHYNHQNQQARFQRILPACTVTGEFLIEG